MDQRLLSIYNRELQHLRDMGGEFAREFPKIAGRLGMDATECADPYVERLLEGFAFLTSRVQLKIESEFPRFTQQLFETLYPQYLSPLPSMAMVQFQSDPSEGALANGPIVPRGSAIRSMLGKSEQTRCVYTTAHDVALWPIEVQEVTYHTRDISSLGLPTSTTVGDRARPPAVGGANRSVPAAIRLRLRTTGGFKFSDLAIDHLVLHLRGQGGVAMRLYEQIFAHGVGIVVHPAARPPAWNVRLPCSSIRQVGFTEEEALLPVNHRCFQGYRLLQEYFTLPERFMFVELTNLSRGMQQCDDEVIDLTILLDEVDVALETELSTRNFALGCTPAINLFEKRLDRIHVSDRHSEFHLVADRTAPLDYEVHSIVTVTGYGSQGQADEQPFESFYAARDRTGDDHSRYYVTHRVPRTLSERERQGKRRLSRYAGSEVYLSLVDASNAPYSSDLRQVAATALCTNRDLPVQMPLGQGKTDFTLESSAPVAAIRCLGSPTPPIASIAEGEFAWRLISHLTPNHLSILNEAEPLGGFSEPQQDDGGGLYADDEKGKPADAAALREVLSLYAPSGQPEIRKQIEGVRSVRSRSIVRRLSSGPASFVRGVEVTLTFDELAFEGTGAFLLGAVLERFFARYVTINVFTETVIHSLQRGEVMRWPVRIGLQQNL